MAEEHAEDLRIDGDGSPVSLKKALKVIKPEGRGKEFMVLLDQSGSGILNDNENTITIAVEDTKYQAHWFSENAFNGTQVPAYLFRHLLYYYQKGEYYKTDQELKQAFDDGKITKESEEYKFILNLIKYCKGNPSAAHAIGLIQLFAGTLWDMKKRGMYARIYLEHPESHQHPQQERGIMQLLYRIRDEYGLTPEEIEALDELDLEDTEDLDDGYDEEE